MGNLETTMGGPQEAFPETCWSTALSAPASDPARRQAALNQLFGRYWRPIYRYMRVLEGASVEDAKDLTQEFFRYLLEGDVLTKYEVDKGRFRHFLKGVLRNFVSEARRNRSRLKRGGGQAVVSLDAEGMEARHGIADDRCLSPEAAFDQQWAGDLLGRALDLLRRRLTEEGKTECLRVYEAYELAPSKETSPTYETVAQALNLSVFAVKNHLDCARTRLEEILRELISDSVVSREELAREMLDLFGQ